MARKVANKNAGIEAHTLIFRLLVLDFKSFVFGCGRKPTIRLLTFRPLALINLSTDAHGWLSLTGKWGCLRIVMDVRPDGRLFFGPRMHEWIFKKNSKIQWLTRFFSLSTDVHGWLSLTGK